MNNFVRYVAQYPTIAPQVVFRRLKYMSTFFLIGVIGIGCALTLIGRDVSMSEPARLLTAFGFVAGAVVVVAAVFSAGLLLWGGFISQYVANLESRSEITELFDLQGVPAFSTAFAVAPATTDVILRAFTANVATVANVIEQVAPSSSSAVSDLRKELASMEDTFNRIKETISAAEQQRVYLTVQLLDVSSGALRDHRAASKEEIQEIRRLLEERVAASRE